MGAEIRTQLLAAVPINLRREAPESSSPKIADSLCPGLMQKIRSPSKSESKTALAKYKRLVERLDNPHDHVWFSKITSWAKRLFALTVPVTKSNSLQWWKVAKVYLYERWEKAQNEFKPLIKHLGSKFRIHLSGKILTNQ